MGTRRDHPVLAAVGLLVLFAALVLVAPGALVTFAAEHAFRLRLDVGQRWTWAIAVSVVAACVMALRSREGLGRYALLAAVASAAVLARAVRNAPAVGERDAVRVRTVRAHGSGDLAKFSSRESAP